MQQRQRQQWCSEGIQHMVPAPAAATAATAATATEYACTPSAFTPIVGAPPLALAGGWVGVGVGLWVRRGCNGVRPCMWVCVVGGYISWVHCRSPLQVGGRVGGGGFVGEKRVQWRSPLHVGVCSGWVYILGAPPLALAGGWGWGWGCGCPLQVGGWRWGWVCG